MDIHNNNNTASSKIDKSDLSIWKKVVKIYLEFIGVVVLIILVFNNIMQFINYFEDASSGLMAVIIFIWSIFLVLLYLTIKKIVKIF